MTSSVKMVTLISQDGEEFVIPVNIAGQSLLIKNMLDDVGDTGKVVPLDNVKSATLAKVMEYCTKHAEHEATAEGSAEELKKWDDEFLKVDYSLLFEIILAANYMDIKSLLDSACQAVADNIKNKTPEEVRRIFNIKNDFTPEEEAAIRKEYSWAFED